MFCLEYLFAEGWLSPAITMVINSVSPQNKGYAVSAVLFMETVAGTASNIILGALEEHYDAKNHKHLYGTILCNFVVFAYAGSIPFFLLAGYE